MMNKTNCTVKNPFSLSKKKKKKKISFAAYIIVNNRILKTSPGYIS